MIDESLVVSLIFDDLFCSLPEKTKNREYVFKEIRKIVKHHHAKSKSNPLSFIRNFDFANEVWLETQRRVRGDGIEYSIVLLLKFLRENYPSIDKQVKFNQKNFTKLEKSYDLTKHILRSKHIANMLDATLKEYMAARKEVV